MNNWIKSAITGMLLERPGQKLTLAEHAAHLDQAGRALSQDMRSLPGTDANRDQLLHIIGIERWSQSRLAVALGEPLQQDEYTDYRPSDDMDWLSLRAEFETTRDDTLALIAELEAITLDPNLTIPHNQYGPLTVSGWLRYIDVHASWESKRFSK